MTRTARLALFCLGFYILGLVALLFVRFVIRR
jgi:hypothetical protein